MTTMEPPAVIYIGDWSGMLRAHSVNGDASEHGDALSPPCPVSRWT